MGSQFLDLSPEFSSAGEASWIIVPVPFDATTCYRPGARFGPQAIIEASCQMELFDDELLFEPYTCGIHTLNALEPLIDPREMAEKVEQVVAPLVSTGKKVCVLGGDHSVSIGAIEAVKKVHGRINCVQFDAHLDLRDNFQGSPYSHACVMRRVWEGVNPIQIGIRSYSKEEHDFIVGQPHSPITASSVHQDLEGVIANTRERLESALPTYVTIDLDCLDPSIMPAVGTPEPGGLGWFELLALLRAITQTTTVIGFDCVELAPVPGLNHPEYTASRLIYKMIGYCSQGPGRDG